MKHNSYPGALHKEDKTQENTGRGDGRPEEGLTETESIELTRRVKEDIRTCHIPVILLTAKDSVEDKEEGYDCGADSYLTKPFSARLLQSRIQNLLSSRRRLAELTAFDRRYFRSLNRTSDLRSKVLSFENKKKNEFFFCILLT